MRLGILKKSVILFSRYSSGISQLFIIMDYVGIDICFGILVFKFTKVQKKFKFFHLFFDFL